MGKRLVLVFCALFVLAMAVPAFAAVQNIKVGGDITARYISRGDFDLTKDAVDDDDNVTAFNSIVRVRVDADLTDNVSACVRLINERNWDVADATSTDIDLDLAYVTLKEFLYSPLTLTIGRQELHFGNDMIIGDGVGGPNANIVSGGVGTNQTTNYKEAAGYGSVNGDLASRKAFDAIRATLNYDPLVIDIVYAKIDENNIGLAGQTNDDMDLVGINAGYQLSDKWNTMVEGYVWSKINRGNKSDGAGSNADGKDDTCTTLGFRVNTNPSSKLNIQHEFAFQTGEKYITTGQSRERSAWATQHSITYVPGWKYEPVLGLVYSYFSGDADSTTGTDADKKYHAWDPMFENQTAGSIINALYAQSNAHCVDVNATIIPVEDVTVRLDYVKLLLAKASTAGTTNPSDYGAFAIAADKKDLGSEVDLNVMYDYTEDVQFGLLLGWYMPGKAVAKATGAVEQRKTATEAIASCRVAF